jgi:NAD(P)-dependent dehydrogenase (short-subunit alcohol dehydrogenase family)
MEKSTGKPLVSVVAGATGAVGEGIALALLAAGWHVHAMGRDAVKLQTLVSKAPDNLRLHLHTHAQDFEDEKAVDETCRDVLATEGQVDMVVASLGGWWQGPDLAQTALADWRKVMHNNLEAHFLCARQWWPVLRANPQSAYVMINGGAALSPVAQAGPVSVAAGAQLSLKNALAAESHIMAPRVYSVLANTPVITRDCPAGRAGWLDTLDLANACISCFEDLDKSHHGATLMLNPKMNHSNHEYAKFAAWRWHDQVNSARLDKVEE